MTGMRRSALPGTFLALGAITTVGCSQGINPVFKSPAQAIAWPPAPAESRIRYVGQITSSADLKAPPKLFQPLADLLAGPTPPSPLYGPRMALRGAHSQALWVADPGGRCLHLFDLTDRTYRKIEQTSGGRFLSPVGLCQGPETSVYACDSESGAVVRFDEETGNEIETLRTPEELRRPVALAYRPDPPELYIVDSGAHDIKVLDPRGGLLRIIGQRGVGKGEFNYPCAIADDGNWLWIVDSGNNRVQAISPSGEPQAAWGQAGDATGDLALPKGVALDSDRNVYVVDARFENVQVFDRAGRLLLAFGEEGNAPGEFALPGGIFIDADDRIWVCDSYNRRVQVFDYVRSPTSRPTEEAP